MNPQKRGKVIQTVVNRLVRQWCRFKYDYQLLPFSLKCGGNWDDSDIQSVLDRVHQADVRTLASLSCVVSVIACGPKNFEECVSFVKASARASILPPVVVQTKSGDWVVVVNQGNQMLQGFSSDSGKDYVYVDKDTFGGGCLVLDVVMKKRWLICGCLRWSTTPKPTKLFRSGSDVNVVFKQTELDTALLEETNAFETILS